MKKFSKLFFIVVLTLISGQSLFSQVNVTATIGTLSGSYATLGAAFTAINAGTHKGVITIGISAYTNETTTTASLNASGSGSASYTSITISPTGGGARTITGATTAGNALIQFNGADNVTIDGLNTGGNSLTISNTQTSNTGGTSTIKFIGDATQNLITNCTVLGSSTTTTGSTGGTIFFSTATTTGNDNNSITNCNIGPAGTNLPTKAINGSGTSAAKSNDNITISNCNIYDFFSATISHAGIYVTTGCSNWTISNNRFYQTASRSATTLNIIHSAIQLASSTINGCIISGNTIGYSSSAGTGTYTINSGAEIQFFPIYISTLGTTTATAISNNVITNISYTATITVSSIAWVQAINVATGLVNVTGNTIGASSGTGAFVVNYNGAAMVTFVFGIANSVGAAGDINNNIIGSITLGGTTTSTAVFRGIPRSGAIGAGNTININNNTIGSTTTANSIQVTNTTRPYEIEGIYATNTTGIMNVTGDTISNINNTSSSTASFGVVGIFYTGTSTPTISNNVIETLNDNTNAVGFYTIEGIYAGSTASGQIFSGNTIANLSQSVSTAGAISNIFLVAAGSGTITKNRIYGSSVPNSTTASKSEIDGISNYAGTWTISNNQITMTNGQPSSSKNSNGNPLTINNTQSNSIPTVSVKNEISLNGEAIGNMHESSAIRMPQLPVLLRKSYSHGRVNDNINATNDVEAVGIVDNTTGASSYYYNSIYLGGSNPAGTLISACLFRVGSNTLTLRDNLFFNARTGVTGSQFCISNRASAPATGWSSSASNYNVLISSDATLISEWGAGVSCTIDTWRTSSGGDKQTWSTTNSVIAAANLFNSVSTGDLGIQTGNTEAWIVSGKGIAVTGQSSDFSGNSRSTTVTGGCTDIGSVEFAATPPGDPTATESAPPADGITTTYTLWGRTICSIAWGSGGTYPASMTVNYYSGVNPGNVIGGNYSNSHTTITINGGSFSGTTYDLTYYFGDNETSTITTPYSSNIELAKYDPSVWSTFQPGGGVQQTQLTYNSATETYIAFVTGLTDFSDYALTDLTSPLPVDLCQFSAVSKEREIALNWETCSEINNSGFDVERRMQLDIRTNSFTSWNKVTFIAGHGTTNQPQNYSCSDLKLSVGKYQYRLKQIDYNGASKYYNLQNPNIIEIGKPVQANVSQNYPNPSNPKSKIDYQIPFNGKVSIKVYDIIGREIVTVVNEVKEAGFYTAVFDGTNIASGVYFYRILAEGDGQKFTQTRKMVLVK